jgi:hypothetical protein
MKEDNKWLRLAIFLSGSLLCYILLQIPLFKIKYELDVPELLMGFITLFIAIYIAQSIQSDVNKKQTVHSTLYSKFEKNWILFNSFSESLRNVNSIDLEQISKFFKQSEIEIQLMRKYFMIYGVNILEMQKLENELSSLECILENLPITQNVIHLKQNDFEIADSLSKIDLIYTEMLKEIYSS